MSCASSSAWSSPFSSSLPKHASTVIQSFIHASLSIAYPGYTSRTSTASFWARQQTEQGRMEARVLRISPAIELLEIEYDY